MHITPSPARTLADFTSLALIIPSLQGRTFERLCGVHPQEV